MILRLFFILLVLTPTPTPLPDEYEPNNTTTEAVVLYAGQAAVANLITDGTAQEDRDYYKIYVKAGVLLSAETLNLTHGVDTELVLLEGTNELARSTDLSPTEPRSRCTIAINREGWITILVQQQSGVPAAPFIWTQSYTLQVDVAEPATATPTMTPTATATATPNPSATARPRPVIHYLSANQVQIVAGESVMVRYDLSGANKAFLDGEGVECPGEKKVRLYQTHTFRLVAANEVGQVEQTLTIEVVAATAAPTMTPVPTIPPTATPAPTMTRRPAPPPATATTFPTATPLVTRPVQVIAQDTPPPTAAPTARPAQPVTVDLVVYYDENNNKAPDGAEGVSGASVRVLDTVSNIELAHAYTDERGHVQITTLAADGVRVSVPLLTFSLAVQSTYKSIEIRIKPLRLPGLIP